ncbi:hypothetical protein V6N13_048657 [Hibiscus sabdariffa]|uniref:Uncharacterized protein n=1 Tax=Hibiscus sabdariffa TaxID=183260 RepID=A0ABR2DLX0_9ROSI
MLEDGVWNWSIHLRRRLFDWELDEWNLFNEVLANIKIGSLAEDSLRWVADSNAYPGRFGRNGVAIGGSTSLFKIAPKICCYRGNKFTMVSRNTQSV